MSSEDKIQISDRAYLNVGVAGTTVTPVERRGPIASITAPVNGTLRVTLNQPIPNAQLVCLVNPYAAYCVINGGLDAASTDTVKDFLFADAAGAPQPTYGVRILLSRRVGQP